MLFKKTFLCRIPKLRRRRNSEDLITRQQILQLVYEFLLFPSGVKKVATSIWADVDTSKSPLRIIYLASFSIQVPQNRVKQCCSIPYNDTTNLSAAGSFIFPNDHSQQQLKHQSRPRIYSDPRNPNLFSASSGLENGNARSGGEEDMITRDEKMILAGIYAKALCQCVEDRTMQFLLSFLHQ